MRFLTSSVFVLACLVGGGVPASAQRFIETVDGRAEVIGLERWTPVMLADSLGLHAPGVSLFQTRECTKGRPRPSTRSCERPLVTRGCYKSANTVERSQRTSIELAAMGCGAISMMSSARAPTHSTLAYGVCSSRAVGDGFRWLLALAANRISPRAASPAAPRQFSAPQPLSRAENAVCIFHLRSFRMDTT
jgi:hypothetical protein